MKRRQIKEIDNSCLPINTEKQLADWRRARGAKVFQRGGSYWSRIAPGFFQPVHWLARLPIERTERPATICWGYQTTLADTSAPFANATMPVHLLPELDSYDMGRLSSRQRNKLRNCHKQVEFIEICGPDLLLEQGHAVYSSAVERTGYGSRCSLPRYAESCRNFFKQESGLIVGGLVEERLAGYITAYAVGSTAYIEDVFIQTDHLRSNISLGLFYAVVQVCQRAPEIQVLVHGLHTPENQSLCKHKEGLGFKVVQVPAKAWFLGPARQLLQRLRPDTYYRLTGTRQGTRHAGADDTMRTDYERLRHEN